MTEERPRWRRALGAAPGPRLCEAVAADAAAPCGCCSPIARQAAKRVTRDINRRMLLGGAAALTAGFLGMKREAAAEPPAAPDRPIHFTNLRLFDGVSGSLRQGVGILVKGNRIDALPPAGERIEGARVVDCGGRLAMPGLIDAHWHSTLCAVTQTMAMTADVALIHLIAAREAERTLLRGFTTVRDAGGPAFALKQAIDGGIVSGPRIFPSGAMISQTSGHGDFRMRYEVPRATGTLSHAETAGVAAIADGEAEVLRRVREQLMLGATQVKLMAGGGVSSPYDPLDVTQFTERELRAAVDAASDWGTYVMVHVYTARAIERAIRAGAKSIEHGQLADDNAARMMADEGVWWSLQPFLADADANQYADPRARAKQLEVARGTERAYELSRRYKVKTGWGTDILFSPQNLAGQGRQLAKLAPRFYAPLELLGVATGRNGELVAMSGARDPYDGPLGIIAKGALADILIADGDPTQSLDFLAEPDTNLKLVMKDGRIYKDALP